MPLRCGLAVAFTLASASHGHESVSYPEDGSLMLLQTRASMMKIAVENGTEEAPVELVSTSANASSSANQTAQSTAAANQTAQSTAAANQTTEFKPAANQTAQAQAGANATAEHTSGLAATAPISEDGYLQVLQMQDSNAMETYVKRVGDDLDIAVAGNGKRALKGFAPWFSGEKANRTLLRMQNEMVRISKIPRSWLTRKGASSPLNEVGLSAVSSLRDNHEMEKFVSRVALEMMDLEVTDKQQLSGMVPFYNGLKGKKGFDVLLNELEAVKTANNTWLNLRHKSLEHSGEDCMPKCEKAGLCDWCGHGNACCKKGGESSPDVCKGAMSEFKTEKHECVAIATGQTATMDWKGYAAVVALKNDTQMERFVRRKAAKLDMTVKSDQALRGFVPFFSGTKGNRPFGALEVEMKRVAHKTNGWLSPRGSTAPLNEEGYQMVAGLGSSLEMVEFAHRVANDMNFDVIKEEGLRGMVPYYSGERTKSNFTALKQEMNKVAAKPDGTGWLTPRNAPPAAEAKPKPAPEAKAKPAPNAKPAPEAKPEDKK